MTTAVMEPNTTDDPTGDDPTTYWATVTPEDAAQWLDANVGNRNMRARVVAAYARDMAAGNWLPTGETVKFARGGTLLDGQHRLAAIVESQVPQRLLIIEGLAKEVQAVIDTGAVRNGGDALRLAGMGGNNPYALAAAARLWVLWKSGRLTHYGSGMRNDDRATHLELIETVSTRPDLMDAVHDATRDYDRIGIPVGPQAMARTVLADVDAADAEKFWEALAGYSTDGTNDPRAVLLFTLRQLRSEGQLRRPGQSIGLTFAAWNAWRDGQKITQLPVKDGKGRVLRIPEPI